MKVLLVPPFGMGDNITFLPVAYNLKKNFKSCEVRFLSSSFNGAKEVV